MATGASQSHLLLIHTKILSSNGKPRNRRYNNIYKQADAADGDKEHSPEIWTAATLISFQLLPSTIAFYHKQFTISWHSGHVISKKSNRQKYIAITALSSHSLFLFFFSFFVSFFLHPSHFLANSSYFKKSKERIRRISN